MAAATRRRLRLAARIRRGARTPTSQRHPERATWSESLRWLRDLLETYVSKAEDVLGYLDQLAELDALIPEIDFARFLDVVRAEVKALKAGDLDEGQQGAFGRRGVNVLDVNQLRNLRFRAVAVLGLTERSFPPPPRQDPLLLDDEREAPECGRRLRPAAAGARRGPRAAAVRARRPRGARADLPLDAPRRGGGRPSPAPVVLLPRGGGRARGTARARGRDQARRERPVRPCRAASAPARSSAR